MKEMLIKYNPYRLETTILVDGDAPQQKSKLNFADGGCRSGLKSSPKLFLRNTEPVNLRLHSTAQFSITKILSP